MDDKQEYITTRLAQVLCPKRCHVNGAPCSYHTARARGAAPGVLRIFEDMGGGNRTAVVSLTTGQVMTILTGRLMVDMEDVYKAIDALSGRWGGVMTHQIPLALSVLRPHLATQLPDLASAPAPEFTGGKEEVLAWVAQLSQEHGEMHKVAVLDD